MAPARRFLKRCAGALCALFYSIALYPALCGGSFGGSFGYYIVISVRAVCIERNCVLYNGIPRRFFAREVYGSYSAREHTFCNTYNRLGKGERGLGAGIGADYPTVQNHVAVNRGGVGERAAIERVATYLVDLAASKVDFGDVRAVIEQIVYYIVGAAFQSSVVFEVHRGHSVGQKVPHIVRATAVNGTGRAHSNFRKRRATREHVIGKPVT